MEVTVVIASARPSSGGWIQDGPRTYKTKYGIIAAQTGTYTAFGETVKVYTASFFGRDITQSGDGALSQQTATWWGSAANPFTMEATGYRCRLDDGSAGPAQSARRYQVISGDTLYDIAGKLLGNVNRWPEIYALNRDIIENPDLIYPGQVLKIPAT
jgi:nucleoid-associated protein YgaU